MKKTMDIRRLTHLALLLAILLVMAYTPLGYLPVGPLSLSLLTIPVAIGAMTMGPWAGAFLGTAFGITSFLSAMEGKSAMGAALFNVSPAGYFVVSIGGRFLCGLCAGLIYRAAVKALPAKTKTTCIIGGLACPLLNTAFFMGLLVLLFYNCDYVQNLAAKVGAANPFAFIALVVGAQGLIEAAVCCVVSAAVTVPLLKFLNKQTT